MLVRLWYIYISFPLTHTRMLDVAEPMFIMICLPAQSDGMVKCCLYWPTWFFAVGTNGGLFSNWPFQQ